MISLAETLVNNQVRENVNACLDEGHLGQGKFIKEFEDKVVKYIGSNYAVAVCNGTMADIIALAALKRLRPEKNEVIVPALTFIAQVNSIIANGLKPVFVDIGYDLQISVAEIRNKITDKTLAIFPVHLLGKKCNISYIKQIAKQYNLFVLQDCCEAFGVWEESDFGTFSFFPSHTITTGEGGMIITNDKEKADLARKISNHGRKSDKILEKFHFDIFGLNGKMSNILASIGCAVIDEADKVISKRKENVEIYNKYFQKNWYADSPHAYPLIVESPEERDSILLNLEKNGIEARKLFSCIPQKELKLGGDYPVAEIIGDKGLYLPVHQGLNEIDIKRIFSVLK